MEEIWKDVKGYEGLYKASSLGRIKTVERTINYGNFVGFVKKEMFIRQHFRDGYYYLSLSKNGVSKTKRVHRLIAEAFIPNPENKQEVNHIDCNKINNCVDNLEWCTPRENMKHAYENNRIKHGASLTDGKIMLIREMHRNGINKTVISNVFKISNQYVSKIIFKRAWKHVSEDGDLTPIQKHKLPIKNKDLILRILSVIRKSKNKVLEQEKLALLMGLSSTTVYSKLKKGHFSICEIYWLENEYLKNIK